MLVCAVAHAATRPHYGGSLRIETRATVQSLDVAQGPLRPGAENIVPLIGDTLVGLDANARPVPRLATRWQTDNGYKRWQFWIRPGVFLHNGASLTPAYVAQSLAAANANWKVQAGSEAVTIESELPVVDMPAELSRPGYAIFVHDSGQLIGTGPFQIADFQPGKKLLLTANDNYWRGRPYLDSVEITFGKNLRDQAVDLQLGRADVIESGVEQARHANTGQGAIVSSWPAELVAIQFARGSGASEDPRIRQAISLAIDRSAIYSVLLQRQGEASAALLPQWISGYAYLFSTSRDLARARELRSQVAGTSAPVTLGYDPADDLARVVAERIAVNARDAGIAMQVVPGNTAAALIVRVPVVSDNAKAALASILARLDSGEIPRVLSARSAEDLYAAEKEVLEQWRIVPIAQLPQDFALGPRVHDWIEPHEGGWPLANVWMEAASK
jgi:peptide/nickel transport system substrate-binding protein